MECCPPSERNGVRDGVEYAEHDWLIKFVEHRVADARVVRLIKRWLHAGRNAQAVGEATTTAVVKGLVWIITAACVTTVVFQSLDL